MRAGWLMWPGASLGLVAALLCALPMQALRAVPAQAQATTGVVRGDGPGEHSPSRSLAQAGTLDASPGADGGQSGKGTAGARGEQYQRITGIRVPAVDPSPVAQSDPSIPASPGESPNDPSPTAGDPSPNPPVDPTPTAGPPTPASPAPGPPGQTATPAVGASVSAGNAVLTGEYWKGRTTTSFPMTATNVGTVAETVAFQITYPLPAGIQAASCANACTLDLRPGETRSLRITLRVAPDAWKLAPLGGSLLFTATAPGATPKSGTTGWGVVFPPGPPTPGLKLQVFDVQLGREATAPATLKAQLTNTGKVPAGGTISVVAPAGVTFGALPAGCRKQRTTVAECTIATVGAGRSWAVQVPLAVPARLRAEAPLVGLVRAVLRPSGQSVLQTQASYQIFAPAGQSGVTVGTSTDGSPGPGGLNLHDRAARFPMARPALVWPIISGSLVLLAVVVVGMVLTLRDRREDEPASRPAGATPTAEKLPAQPAPADRTAVISAGPVDRTPTPRGPISWEWRTGEEPIQPAEPDSPDGVAAGPDSPAGAAGPDSPQDAAAEPAEQAEPVEPAAPPPVSEAAAGGTAEPAPASV